MKYLVGIDEVGRGPLAGPVSIGIAVVPASFDFSVFSKLNDSKQMTEKAREACAKHAEVLMTEGQMRFGVFSSPSSSIDTDGIEKCISSLIGVGLREFSLKPAEAKVYLDGRLKAPKEYEQETVIGGGAKVAVMSLASVVAKVERDRYMKEVLHPQFPEYGFVNHKGYGTASHIQALREYGASSVHRKSFLSRILPSAREASTIPA